MSRIRITLAIFGVILFALIGIKWMDTYSLWDDESNTALFAQSVQNTGDTSAVIGHNIIAYRNGAELNKDQKSRYVSPLQYYYLALFFDVKHQTPFKARLPFFLLTLISISIIYRRLLKLELPIPMHLAFTCLSLGLTSFLLFGIQCRYYSLTLIFTLLLAEQYWFTKMNKTIHFFRFGLVSSLLFISNYLVGVAVLMSLLIHTIITKKQKISKISAFLFPHIIISLPVLLIWNPIGKKVVEMKNSPIDKLNLLFRNVRDFNGGQLGSILLLLIGAFLLKKETQKRFKGYAIILITYLFIISILSPQPVHGTGMADIRYLYPLMLLSFAWTLDFYQEILKKNKALFIVCVMFFSFISLPYSGEARINFIELINELSNPSKDPYQQASTELNKIPQIEGIHPSLLSSVDFATYPLMFLSPSFKYIQAETSQPPDYLVEFCDDSLKKGLEKKYSVRYQRVSTVQSSCREAFRPETFLRSFGIHETLGEIEIFKKI